MPKASVADLDQMYTNSVCIHKNKPYLILGISPQRKALVKNLMSQREDHLDIDVGVFTAPTQRLGFINLMGVCVYASRTPIRRYKVGLSKENFQTKHLDVKHPQGMAATVVAAKSLSSVELGDCILGKYPTLPQAFAKCQAGYEVCAFDRQFAVTKNKVVYYKLKPVGKITTNNPKGIEDIQFLDEYAHLHYLLGNKHESILQTSGS